MRSSNAGLPHPELTVDPDAGMFTIERTPYGGMCNTFGYEGRRSKAVVKVGPRFVHIVEDNATFRKTIEGRLKEFGYEVSTYPSAQHLLDRLPSDDVPSCILLDVRLPGMSGPELQERLIELGLTFPVIFLSGYSDIPTTVRTIKAGGEDFLIKPVTSDVLLAAIERAIARHDASRKLLSERNVQRARVASLTPRERQVFDLVVRGKANKQIALELGSTERTIKAHRHNVMEKMDVGSLAELVLIAERLGHSAE